MPSKTKKTKGANNQCKFSHLINRKTSNNNKNDKSKYRRSKADTKSTIREESRVYRRKKTVLQAVRIASRGEQVVVEVEVAARVEADRGGECRIWTVNRHG